MIGSIRLQNFRSYEDESIEFDTGVNIVVGANASGKTNLLEAILVVCRGNSFRAKDQEMIRHKKPWARLDAQLVDGQNRSLKLMRQESTGAYKEYDINGQKLRRLLPSKQIPVVLFEPNHLQMLHGPPEQRRDYLDHLLGQLIAGYGQLLYDYKRALHQRNALLKQGPSKKPELFAWDIRLSETGGKIAVERINLLKSMKIKLNNIYQTLAGNNTIQVDLEYKSKCQANDYASSLLRQLEANQNSDTERGFTGVGPHRDDMLLKFNDREASLVASRGETRTILLTLKVLELELVEENRARKPLLLLDDVFSELDGARRRALTELIKGYQTFITTTDADVVVQHFMDRCHIIPINQPTT